MPSVVDVAGLNSISQYLISQAAAAICAMASVSYDRNTPRAGRIAISMFGNTTACVDHCSSLLKNQGYEVFAFHSNGIGGQNMEALIREGCFDAVLDITTTELADDLCGGICSAGPDRLKASVDSGIPQVVVPGCLDMVNFAQWNTLPEKYRSRELYSWAPDVTLMRTNEEENLQLGEEIAKKLNQSAAAVTVLLPTKGLSQIDAGGEVFYHPEINQVLFDTIKDHVREPVKVMEVNAHINDSEFSERAVKSLMEFLEKKRGEE